jgi:pimeloyl-ACP methyl ester carboxylesterase
MNSRSDDSSDIESGRKLDNIDELPDIANVSSSNLSAASSDTQHIFPTIQVLRQIWNQQRNVARNAPIMQNLMRVMMLIFVLMNSILRVPLSFLGITTNDDTNRNNDKSSNPDDEKMNIPEVLPIRKGIVSTSLGRIGYLICDGRSTSWNELEDNLTPIVCIHACRRSSDEFVEVLPLLARSKRKVLAIDLFSHGMSENVSPNDESTSTCASINNIADAACLEVALSLGGMEKFIIISNGGPVSLALALASRYPKRVMALAVVNMCSSFDILKHSQLQIKEDGSHLLELHNKASWLDPELKLRVVQSELDFWVNERRRQKGGREEKSLEALIGECNMTEMAKQVKCPTVCIKGAMAMKHLDGKGLNGSEQFESVARSFANHELAELSGENSTLNMINQAPNEFAEVCLDYFKRNSI